MNILIFSTIAKCLTSFLKLFMSFLTVVFTQSVKPTEKDNLYNFEGEPIRCRQFQLTFFLLCRLLQA